MTASVTALHNSCMPNKAHALLINTRIVKKFKAAVFKAFIKFRNSAPTKANVWPFADGYTKA